MSVLFQLFSKVGCFAVKMIPCYYFFANRNKGYGLKSKFRYIRICRTVWNLYSWTLIQTLLSQCWANHCFTARYLPAVPSGRQHCSAEGPHSCHYYHHSDWPTMAGKSDIPVIIRKRHIGVHLVGVGGGGIQCLVRFIQLYFLLCNTSTCINVENKSVQNCVSNFMRVGKSHVIW